jgi:nucleoside-diphosphate-sugar epimerase
LSLGNLDPKRDFTYVEDTVNGFLEIYKSTILYGQVTNIGTKESISMKELLFKIYKISGKEIPFELNNLRMRPRRSEVNHLLCDNSKIKSNTNWKQKTNLDDGLTKTYNWLKDNIDLYKSDLYNV